MLGNGHLLDCTLRMYSVTLFRQPRDAGAADVGQLSDCILRMYSVTLFRQPRDAGTADVGQLPNCTLLMYSVTLFRQPRDAGAADVGQLSDWYRRVLWLPIPSLHPLRKVTNLKLKQFFGGAMILL